MVNKEKTIENFNENEVDSNKPLSDKEIASLIRASKKNNFSSVELKVKKDQSNNFKKVTLHEIAKSAKENNNKLSQATNSSELEIKNIKAKENLDEKVIEKENNNEEKKEDDKIEKTKENIENFTEEKVEEKKYIIEEEHKNIIEQEKNIAYENGKKDAYNEIKEGSEAAIASLKKITSSISKVDELDLSNIENLINNKILELSSELSGKIIKALPTEFVKKIKSFLSQLENIEGNIDIYINEDDFKVLEKDKNIKKDIEKLKLNSNKELKSGEIELKVNGITVSQKI